MVVRVKIKVRVRVRVRVWVKVVLMSGIYLLLEKYTHVSIERYIFMYHN